MVKILVQLANTAQNRDTFNLTTLGYMLIKEPQKVMTSIPEHHRRQKNGHN